MDKIFSIYRSSAGSGKTRTLAKEYLKLALKYRSDYFKHILAVTFTNKASQEMKNRILTYLDDFAKGKENELQGELEVELKFDAQTFQQNAQSVQQNILHQYSQFSISTIDAFFQKVIRSFTRESGLIGDYRLEVDHDTILEEVIDNLIDELGSNKELTEWVVQFAKENLENERAWDVRFSLIQFAREIFREEFKTIEDEISRTTAKPGFFKNLKEELWKTKNFFLSQVSIPSQQALKIIEDNGWTPEDFSYGRMSGLFGFFTLFAFEKNLTKFKDGPKGRVRTYFTEAVNWPNKKSPHKNAIYQTAQSKLVPLLVQITDAYDQHYRSALSADVALKNMYVFGLISDMARKLKEYKDENNIMLLADAPKFLNGIIQDSDTPFIYEKVGSFYRNYLIDEFQDTSGMQWKNFQPLITNSLDQGYAGIVVGDVKQAIYRWRGGDLNLLQKGVGQVIGEDRVEVKELDKNFRSSVNVVNFNNALFESASKVVAETTGETISVDAYQDIVQKIWRSDAGFVEIQFIEEPEVEEKNLFSKDDVESDGENTSAKWKDLALDSIPKTFEKLQSLGVELKDIAILVRKNDEGQRIAAHLLHYKNSVDAKVDCRYDVVSNESLRIDGASSVNLLLGAMRYLLNPEDSISRAQLGYEFSRLHEPKRELPDVFAVANLMIFENNLPPEFSEQKSTLKKLPLIELTEMLINIFQLGAQQGELVYLQAFQDLVLEFYNRERNDLGAFLEWWEDNRHKKSVQISGDVNAAQILTIHKSKGLQFKYVIIPFCSWNLDHDPWQSPNLWVKSTETPFRDAGYLPVKYGSILENTCFDSFYKEEHTRTYLDNLNLLYVALTRAESGLIVTSPHPSVKGTKETIASLLFSAIQKSDVLKDNFDETDMTWKSGDWNIQPTTESKATDGIILEGYLSTSWRDKLVIRQSGADYFKEFEPEYKTRINYGLHIHEVLSRMKYAEDVDATLEKILFEGLITEVEKVALKIELSSLLGIAEVASWFSRSWRVQTEVPILLPKGGESRLDRLITDGKKAVVIDFKTGDQKKDDNKQVLEYMSLLKKMNFFDVKGFLLYVRSKEVIEVKDSGNPRIVKKAKDQNQLSLGW